MDPQPSPQQLHLDVLELIVYEYRNDQATLAAIALASQPLLQIARKLLYRSVSLDYCENPYDHDQQGQLRSSLATYPHLCSYVRSLRLSLPTNNTLDHDLDNILDALSRVENLHLIGNGVGVDYDLVTDNLAFVAPMFGPVQLENVGAREDLRTRNGRGLEVALKKVFSLKSLKKVALENIYPLEEVYVSSFTGLKHLELLSVGAGPINLSSLPTSPPNASTVSTSVATLHMVATIFMVACYLSADSAPSMSFSSSASMSSTSLASHPPPSPSPPSSPSTPPNPSSPSLSPSDGASSWRLLLSNPDGIPLQDRERYGQHEDLQGTTNPATRTLSLSHATGSSSDVDLNGISPQLSVASQLAGDSGRYHSATHVAGGSPPFDPDHEVLPVDELGRLKASGKAVKGRRSRTGPSKVYLEYLVLNLEHLRPVLGVMCRPTSQVRKLEGDHSKPARESDAESVLDFSRLKQAHIYVWDSDDGRAIWSILETARKSLERLTLRYFHCEPNVHHINPRLATNRSLLSQMVKNSSSIIRASTASSPLSLAHAHSPSRMTPSGR